MAINSEARRAWQRERASECVLPDASEYTEATDNINQIAWLTARYQMGAAHARVIAEHAFAGRAG